METRSKVSRRGVWARPELHLLLFFVALACFFKPVLLPGPAASPARVYLSFFLPWAVLIVLLAGLARAARPAAQPDHDDDGDDQKAR